MWPRQDGRCACESPPLHWCRGPAGAFKKFVRPVNPTCYAPGVGRDDGPLPEGWDASLPEVFWADAMLTAIRRDPSALCSPRVTETLRRWRDQLHGEDAVARRKAGRLFERLSTALRGGAEGAPPFDPVDLADEPTGPGHRLEMQTDSAVESLTGRPESKPRAVLRAADRDAAPRSEQRKKRRRKRRRRDPVSSAPPAKDSNGDLNKDSKPTPEAVPDLPTRAGEKLDARTRALSGLEALRKELDESTADPQDTPPLVPAYDAAGFEPPPSFEPPPVFEDVSEQPTRAMPIPDVLSSSAPPPPPDAAHDSDAPPQMPPPRGVVQRSRIQLHEDDDEPALPAASMLKVKPLYTAILPLCRELVPLPIERRSRRFWTHWRDVSGNKGVRRAAVEALLAQAGDADGMAAALIAEVQSVDPQSVQVLLARIEPGTLPPDVAPRPSRSEPGKQPLVGASVDVDVLSGPAGIED